MAERRPLWGFPSDPPTTPPTYDWLQELRDAVDPTDTTEDTPLGTTIGDAFPATPQKYHRHFLTNGITGAGEEWFYFDLTRNGGSGRWISEQTSTMVFTNSGGVTNNPLFYPGIGASGANLGYATGGRQLCLVTNYSSQNTLGGDAGLRIRLMSSISGLEVMNITLGNAQEKYQTQRDILIPTLSAVERFYCNAQGTIGTGGITHWTFRRVEN